MTENPNKNMVPGTDEISDDELDVVTGGSFSLPHGDRDDDRVQRRQTTETPRRVDRFIGN